MTTRIAITLILVLLGLGAYWFFTRRQLGRAGQAGAAIAAPVNLRPGVPAVVYFWSEACAPCKLVQSPALEQVQAGLGDRIQVIAINALEQPEVAQAWGVMTVPTTYILDRAGQPRRVNHGVVRAAQLERQIASL